MREITIQGPYDQAPSIPQTRPEDTIVLTANMTHFEIRTPIFQEVLD